LAFWASDSVGLSHLERKPLFSACHGAKRPLLPAQGKQSKLAAQFHQEVVISSVAVRSLEVRKRTLPERFP